MITRAIVRELLNYNPKTGALIWRRRKRKWFKCERICKSWNTRYVGSAAFACLESGGYPHGALLGKKYRAHQIIWLWMTGDWPDYIDHINHNRSDNRWANLQEVDSSTNCRNNARRKDNSSGQVGVSFGRRENKWHAYINLNGKRQFLGYFDDFHEACVARKAAEIKYGFSSSHGCEPIFAGSHYPIGGYS